MIKSSFIASAAALALFSIPYAAKAQTYNNGLIDKTVAIVGDDVVLLSDIEGEVQVMQAQGMATDKDARCEVLEGILTQNLFLNQARLDSLKPNQEAVESELSSRVNNVVSQLGSEAAVEKYFGRAMYRLRDEWRETLTDQMFVQQEQQEIVKKVPKLTPEDVKAYCDSMPEEDLPVISTQYRISQIVLYPKKDSAVMAVKEKLLEFRRRIIKGEKFATLAILYSQDPGSASKGGELGVHSKSIFWPAFSDAAMVLKPGEVSQIVETPDGFHLIQMIERNGDMINVRHILLKPHYTENDRNMAFNRLDSIRNAVVVDSTLTFFDAARIYSRDPKTRTNGGLMADENTGSSYYEKDQLKPADYNILKNLKEGEVSEPFESTDNEGSGNTIYKIIRLDKIIPSHVANPETDYTVLLNDAKNKKSQAALDAFISEKQKSAYIVIDPMFSGCHFKRKGWIK
ncbi:MAG: peptidylprolyl isomerase [Bacteroidales bacterium]|jgi:peptidyl-prolyl cis-trans isomerase SurA|nr:peptidylprolyl isomerase [Bacteroidales bacterium]MCI2122540.1 peptidylprolyl isomerase [Bacteroidales bacterium]MCI2145602.1 peptidylprolyl isomerase [Bacteroidales bacterium]